MTKEKLEKIYDNIQLQMILEQNSGYKNEYSKPLQEKINLYNYAIECQEKLNEIRETIENDCDFNGTSIFDKWIPGKKILKIINKVGDTK